MKIAIDKKLHLLGGWFLASLFINLWFAIIAAVIGGALKELIWDKWMNKGTPDVWDFVATVIGGFLFVMYETIKTII